MALNISSGSRYFIINSKSQTVMDVSEDKKVTGFNRIGGDNQQGDIIYAEGGWHVKNVQHKIYLSLDGGAKDGSVVKVSDEPYIWHLWPDTQQITAGRICVPNTALNLDLDEGSSEPGTLISVWGRHEGWNQVWHFEKV